MGTCFVGNLLLGLEHKRVTIICRGTYQYLVTKLGLMIVQRRGGEKPTSGTWLVSSEMRVVVVFRRHWWVILNPYCKKRKKKLVLRKMWDCCEWFELWSLQWALG